MRAPASSRAAESYRGNALAGGFPSNAPSNLSLRKESARKCVLDERQPIVAKKHRALYEHRGRSESTPRDQLLGVLAQPGLVLVGRNFGEKFLFVEADFAHDLAEHLVLADIAIVAPVTLEHAPRVLHDDPMLIGDQRSAHRLDRIHREHAGVADLEAVKLRPVAQILDVVFGLDRDRFGAALVDRRIDRVEQPAHQNRPPDKLRVMALRDVFNLAKRQVGPRTGAVVKKLELLRHRRISPVRSSSIENDKRRSILPAPDAVLASGWVDRELPAITNSRPARHPRS